MAASIPATFLDAFLKGFTRTFKELLLHGLLFVATLVYWLKIGGIKAHLGESAAPWLWALCFVVAWHSVKAAYLLNKEIGSTLKRGTSIILSEHGKPLELPVAGIPFYRIKVFGIATAAVVMCLMVAILVGEATNLYKSIENAPSTVVPSPPVAIFADCEVTGLPLSIAPQTSLHMLSLNKKFMLSQHWGLADIPNRTDKEQQWPSKQAMDSMKEALKSKKPHFNPGVFGYKCDVLNDSQTNVLDVAITMTFWYDKQTGNDNIKYTPILSPLDASSHFIFYVFNDCPVGVAGVLPDSVTVTVVGENVRRAFPLHLPHRSPIEPIMVFFPSDTQWVRQTPCG